MSSGRLFRSECFSAFRMCSFSVRQRLHRLDIYIYILFVFCLFVGWFVCLFCLLSELLIQ